jgi:hypothetical protein
LAAAAAQEASSAGHRSAFGTPRCRT